MTTTIQNEEDLIIIWDETSSDTSIMDFDFSSQNITQADEANDFILDFWASESISEVTTDFTLDWVSQETTNEVSDISFWDDLFVVESQVEEVKQEEAKQEEVNTFVQEEVDFWFSQNDTIAWEEVIVPEEAISSQIITENYEEKNEEVITSHVQETHFDRNTILDEAIAKMQSRKGSIWQVKAEKQTKVDELQEQINLLKTEVSDLERQIKDLEKEDSALDLDITSIEKMKSSILEVSADRPRKHNLNNIKK